MSTPETVALELDEPTTNIDKIHPELRQFVKPMEDLILDPENANKHDARNLKMIAESLIRFGQVVLLKVNRETNFIEKGNGTYMAAKMLGWTQLAAIWSDLDRTEAIAYGLIDNRCGQTSRPDYAQTGKHLRELKEADYEMMQFWTPEEALPLVRGEFVKPEISDEKFDSGLQRGRPISKISASERITVDRAIAFVRTKDKRYKTEGSALDFICGEFMAYHVNDLDNETEDQIELEALSLE